jgi:hypothetical protein
MKNRHLVIALAVLSACAGAKIDVKTLATAPRPLAPRPVESLQKFETRPQGAVAVYDIDVYGDTKPALDTALHQKAASLGCDGIMLLVHKEAVNTTADTTTGQLNEHHTRPGSHLNALCIVLPASAPAAPASASTTPADAPAMPAGQ